jgi:hypothetical protein
VLWVSRMLSRVIGFVGSEFGMGGNELELIGFLLVVRCYSMIWIYQRG